MKRKNRIYAGLGVGILATFVIVSGLTVIQNNDVPLLEEPYTEEEITWKPLYRWAVGEADPGIGSSGFCAAFLLDYGQTPATALASNTSDWENHPQSHAYGDTDPFDNTDTKAQDPFYFVVRCKFNRTHCYDDTENCFIGSRTRCTLTTSGDETVDRTVYCNNTEETYGGGIESSNTSTNGSIYINFYWDDDNDGYTMPLDGTITVSEIKIEAKY